MFIFWVTGWVRRRAASLQDVARHLCFINKWITNSTNSNNCGSPRLQRFHRSWWWKDVEHTQALICKRERWCVRVCTLAASQLENWRGKRWHWLQVDLMLNISASSLRESGERGAPARLLPMCFDWGWLHLCLHIKVGMRGIDLRGNQCLIKSASVLFINSSVSLFVQAHIRLSKVFSCPPHVTNWNHHKIIFQFSFTPADLTSHSGAQSSPQRLSLLGLCGACVPCRKIIYSQLIKYFLKVDMLGRRRKEDTEKKGKKGKAGSDFKPC